MLPIVATLLQNGLSLLGNAVLAKGQQWVEDKTGVKLGETLTPEQITQLKIAEMQHEEELLKIRQDDDKLDFSRFQAALQDTADARDREVQIATSEKAPYINKVIGPIIAIVVLLLTFTLFGILLTGSAPVDPSRKDVLIYILGVLSTVCTQIVQYYFGSSAGSERKNQMIKDALK